MFRDGRAEGELERPRRLELVRAKVDLDELVAGRSLLQLVGVDIGDDVLETVIGHEVERQRRIGARPELAHTPGAARRNDLLDPPHVVAVPIAARTHVPDSRRRGHH